MDIQEAAGLLRQMYDEAAERLTATSVHLFGIKFARDLDKLSSKKVADGAGISRTYFSEIDKGKRLAEYVSITSTSSRRALNPSNQIQVGTAARILREMIENAGVGKKVVSIHLFGIKYAAELDGVSLKQVCKKAEISESYATEIRTGMRLAGFVVIDNLPGGDHSEIMGFVHPDSKPFPKIEFEIPEFLKIDGTPGSHPFSSFHSQSNNSQSLKHNTIEDLGSGGYGKGDRTEFFIKQIVDIYNITNEPVPYRFIDAAGRKLSMDKGCLKFIGPDRQDLADYELEQGYIVAVKPKPKMLLKVARSDSTISDIDDLSSNPDIGKTERKQFIAARIGQGKFRDDVLLLWGDACAVTGCNVKEALRASHIIPWKDSDNQQRLDPYNGLPLVASLDALFDRGLISFSDGGGMLISDEISDEQREILSISTKYKLRNKLSTKTKGLLQGHRKSSGFE